MPPSLRRRAQQHHLPPPEEADDTDGEVELGPEDNGEALGDELVALGGEEELDDEDEEEEEEDGLGSPINNSTPLPNTDTPPPYLREISTLASWTVSSSKPGCSIPQLRHPSPTLFWQSDGPQPHYLNIHFFKLVRIVGLRLYLDFEQDESYTPTKIGFLAGSGGNDLQEWGEMKLESPRGWVWADFSGVADAASDDEDDDDEEEDGDENMQDADNPQPHMTLPDAAPTSPGRAGGGASSDSENAIPHQHPSPAVAMDEEAQAQQLLLQEEHQQQQHTPLPRHNLHYNLDLNHRLTPTLTSPPTHHAQTSPPTLPRPTPRTPFTALDNPHPRTQQRARIPKMPVLRAHLVQIKILENHQNGKDTHLRGLQIFARNDDDLGKGGGAPEQGIKGAVVAAGLKGGMEGGRKGRVRGGERVRGEERFELGRGAWDMDGDIR